MNSYRIGKYKTMKKIIFLLPLLLLLAACGGEPALTEPAATAASPAEPATAGRPTPTNEPAGATEDLAALPPTLTPASTTAPTAASVTAPPAGDASTATIPTEEPTPPPTEIMIDGQNPDGSFYRGLATAPITMLDYSDFL